MSEQGWRAFIEDDGLDDWVVLHGGATAAFDTATLADAAALALAIAAIDGFAEAGAILTIVGPRLTVRLTRGVFRLEAAHPVLARRVSEKARAHGAHANRSAVQEVSFAVAAKPADIDVGFWRAVLGYAPLDVDNAVDPLGHGSTVWMQELPADKALRHAMHIDVSVAKEDAERRLASAVAAGGRIVEDANAPGSWILADRAGNKVCIAAWPDGADTPAWAAPEDGTTEETQAAG